MDGDISETFHIDTGNIFKLEKTQEGYLNCHARVAKVGILEYLNSDGSKRIERVTHEVLFHKDSYNTLKMKPVTVPSHPPVLLDSSNCQQYSKGSTSNIVTIDGSFLGVVLTITDKEAIDIIESGVTEVSCGYMARTKPLPDGSFQQLSRDYNHIAIVPKGRAGKDVRITMDSSDVPIIYSSLNETSPMSTVTLKIDEYTSVELPTEVAIKVSDRFKADSALINDLKAKCDELAEKFSEITQGLIVRGCASFDELLAKYDGMRESISSLKANLDAQPSVDIPALLRARRSLERKCDGLLPENFNLDTASDRDLMIGVLSAKTKIKDYTTLSDEYVKARFDGVLEFQDIPNTSQIALEATNLAVTSTPSSNMSELDKLRLDVENAKAEYQKSFVIIK